MSTKEREALARIVAMDPEGKRADDLGAAVRIARAALDAPVASSQDRALQAIINARDTAEMRRIATLALDGNAPTPSAPELSDADIAHIGHRKAWRYKHSSDPNHSSTYTFNRACLIAFGRAILAAAKAQGGGEHG